MIDFSNWIERSLCDGRYRIERLLGKGGMGVVFRAHDQKLHTTVAVKAVKPHLLVDSRFVERFDREIRSLVSLAHPHVVGVQDVGHEDGVPFFVMQYLSGGSLENRYPQNKDRRRQPAPPVQLHNWLPVIADALDFAHHQGYIHRDVKPGNILFDPHGNAHLSDFGLAKVIAASPNRFGAGGETLGTGIVGTPGYIAPEITAGHGANERSDQFSLATVVYELTAGRLPSDPSNRDAKAEGSGAFLSLRQVAAHAPAGLSEAVQRALAWSPQQRFPSCREFCEAALESIREEPLPPPIAIPSTTAIPPAPPRPERHLATEPVEQVASGPKTMVAPPPASDHLAAAETPRRRGPFSVVTCLGVGIVTAAAALVIYFAFYYSGKGAEEKEPATLQQQLANYTPHRFLRPVLDGEPTEVAGGSVTTVSFRATTEPREDQWRAFRDQMRERLEKVGENLKEPRRVSLHTQDVQNSSKIYVLGALDTPAKAQLTGPKDGDFRYWVMLLDNQVASGPGSQRSNWLALRISRENRDLFIDRGKHGYGLRARLVDKNGKLIQDQLKPLRGGNAPWQCLSVITATGGWKYETYYLGPAFWTARYYKARLAPIDFSLDVDTAKLEKGYDIEMAIEEYGLDDLK